MEISDCEPPIAEIRSKGARKAKGKAKNSRSMSRAEQYARHDAVLAEMDAGHDVYDVSEKHGLSVATILAIFRQRGADKARIEMMDRSESRKIGKTTLIAIGLLLSGMNMTDIAKRLGRSKQRIHQIKVEAMSCGIVFPKRGDKPNKNEDQVC